MCFVAAIMALMSKNIATFYKDLIIYPCPKLNNGLDNLSEPHAEFD